MMAKMSKLMIQSSQKSFVSCIPIATNDGSPHEHLNFDYIFGPDEDNGNVFAHLIPLFESAIERFNVCIIAYGASG